MVGPVTSYGTDRLFAESALEQPSAVCDYLHKSIGYLRTIT